MEQPSEFNERVKEQLSVEDHVEEENTMLSERETSRSPF